MGTETKLKGTAEMIKGFSSLNLSSVINAINRYTRGPAADRGIQPMPGQDTIQLSRPGRHAAGLGEFNRTVPERPAVYGKPPAHAAVHRLGDLQKPAADISLLERIRASLLSVEGDDRFDTTADLNSDGIINLSDLKMLRDQMSHPEPSRLERMRESFLSRTGEANFDSEMDLNSDGVINLNDLALLRSELTEQEETLEPAPPAAEPPAVMTVMDPAEPNRPRSDNELLLDRMRAALYTGIGDDSFDSAVDLNGVGLVNLTDLAHLRSRS